MTRYHVYVNFPVFLSSYRNKIFTNHLIKEKMTPVQGGSSTKLRILRNLRKSINFAQIVMCMRFKSMFVKFSASLCRCVVFYIIKGEMYVKLAEPANYKSRKS